MSLSNAKILKAWRNGGKAKNGRGSLWTQNGELFSYDLMIGKTIDGLRHVGDYTADGGSFVSMTTSRHVNLAKRWADEIEFVSTFAPTTE